MLPATDTLGGCREIRTPSWVSSPARARRRSRPPGVDSREYIILTSRATSRPQPVVPRDRWQKSTRRTSRCAAGQRCAAPLQVTARRPAPARQPARAGRGRGAPTVERPPVREAALHLPGRRDRSRRGLTRRQRIGHATRRLAGRGTGRFELAGRHSARSRCHASPYAPRIRLVRSGGDVCVASGHPYRRRSLTRWQSSCSSASSMATRLGRWPRSSPRTSTGLPG